MTPKRQPTNLDLSNQIKDIKKMQISQDTRITDLDGKVHALELYKQAEDMYRATLKRIRDEEDDTNVNKEISARTDLWIKLGKLAGLMILAVGAYLAGKGIQ